MVGRQTVSGLATAALHPGDVDSSCVNIYQDGTFSISQSLVLKQPLGHSNSWADLALIESRILAEDAVRVIAHGVESEYM